MWSDETGIQDIPFIRRENSSLGEMYRESDTAGVRVPNFEMASGPSAGGKCDVCLEQHLANDVYPIQLGLADHDWGVAPHTPGGREG